MSIDDYFSNWQHKTWTCSQCSWNGRGDAAAQAAFSELFELNCPNCDSRLSTILYPTHDGIRRAAAAGNAEAIGMLSGVHAADRFRAALRAARMRLADLTVTHRGPLEFRLETITDGDWMNPTHLLVMCNDEEVHREPSGFEHWESVIEIGQLLKARFGDQMLWYDPGTAGEALLGENSNAVAQIRTFLASAKIAPSSGPWASELPGAESG